MLTKQSFLRQIRWNDDNLVPAIIQDHKSAEVLMLAWMNQNSLEESLRIGRTVFWSRSRQELWAKGDTSGAVQYIKEIRLDCDDDCLLIKVEQMGKGACHTGRPSCFYKLLDSNNLIKNNDSSKKEVAD
ncbi:MAG: phosphoribosyl-AMP cyclohydrolase [Candidatus Portiera sp.]|nr:phosphoribosyl-AMP cyclohydrolase [Portiera sp.]